MIFQKILPALVPEERSVWNRLATNPLPLVLYGTGDGADKILAAFNHYGIQAAGIFVSDEFYRGQTFQGFTVQRLADLEARGGDFLIVVAFGSRLPALWDRVMHMAARHPLVIPDVPVYGEDLFTSAYARRHYDQLQLAYSLLADEESRRVFTEVLQYKLDGEVSHLIATVSDRQEDLATLLRLSEEEHYLDLGAYRGDTIEEFLTLTQGRYASITALEPDPRSFKKLHAYAHAMPHTTLLACGVAEEPKTLPMQVGRGRGTAAGGTVSVPFTSVDALQKPFTYIKMDVEGMEAAALLGAATTIRRYHPKLSIACYHRSEDLFRLPLLLHRLNPAYRIYLRRSRCFPCWELNLYCIDR